MGARGGAKQSAADDRCEALAGRTAKDQPAYATMNMGEGRRMPFGRVILRLSLCLRFASDPFGGGSCTALVGGRSMIPPKCDTFGEPSTPT
jgi:hypothetical protein